MFDHSIRGVGAISSSLETVLAVFFVSAHSIIGASEASSSAVVLAILFVFDHSIKGAGELSSTATSFPRM